MKTFTDFRQHTEASPVATADDITESRGFLRKGAAAAFTLQSRNHSKSAQSSFKQSLTALTGAKGKSTPEKLDALCEAFEGLLAGLYEMTKQLNQTTAVSASSALLNERTDQEILNLLKQARTSRRRR